MFIENADTGATKKQTTTQTEEDRTVWKTAKKLGVAKELEKADSDVYKDFKEGVKNARNVATFKNLDTDSPNTLKYTEALVKKSLAAPLKDETPWVQAVEDSKVALSSDDVKEYQSLPLKSYLKMRSGWSTDSDSAFKTNYDARLTLKEERLAGHFNAGHDEVIRQEIDQNSLFDDSQNVDGNEYWYDQDTLQGIGITADGKVIAGDNISAADRALLQLNFLYHQDTTDEAYKQMLLHKMQIIKKANPDSQVKITDSLADYAITDVTQNINGQMATLEYMYGENKKYGWLVMLPAFYEQVKNGSEVDLKNQEKYKGHEVFLYDGEYVSRDALGNILYGYLGKCYGIPDKVLFMGAGYAQVASGLENTKFKWKDHYYDDPRDAERIQQGIDIYNKVHSE